MRKKKRDRIMEQTEKAEEISALYETESRFSQISDSIANSIIGDPQWGGQWRYDRVIQPTVYPSTGTQPVVHPGVPEMYNECLEKHVIEEIAQYPDGVFGNCAKCSTRVQIPTVPGGYTAVQVRGFLERVIAGDESEDDGELLVELGKLLAILNLEEEELLLAKNRVQIARTILTDRAAV